jgi:hypothetical protein
MSEADHLPQLLGGKSGSATSNDTTDNGIHSHVTAPGSSQITNVNTLSTPVLIAIMAGMAACLALSLVSLFIAQQAKTEARVALNHAEEGRIANEVNKALIQAYLPPKKDK